MKMNQRLLKTSILILSLMLFYLVGLPSSPFAVRNPKEIYRPVDPSADLQSRPPVPLTTVDLSEEDEDDGEDAPQEEAVLPLRNGEVCLTDSRASSFRIATGFDAFNLRHQNRWKATFSEKTGRVKLLYGASSAPFKDEPESGAREFLKGAHSLFGLKQDLSDLKTQRVHKTPKRNHVRFQQTHNGVPVLGAQVLVHSDYEGRVTMVQNDYLDSISIANQDLLSLETARDIARNDLRASLREGAILSEPKVEKLLIPYRDQYHYIWKVSIPTRNPWGLWVYHVDAGNGEVLYRGDEIFYLATGRGRAYLNNDKWWAGDINNVLLKHIFGEKDGYEKGWLRGSRASVFCFNPDDDPFAPNLQFFYYPDLYPHFYSWHKPRFDATHAYFQKNSVWEWWDKQVIRKYGPKKPDYFYDLSPTVVVNFVGEPPDPPFCNAFYHPDLGGKPGFSYGNENECFLGSEDLVIDNDVVRHEYAHAVMHWAGFENQFGGDENHYGRAMGEGNSDWYAFLFSKKPEIADVAFPPYLRNLDNTRMYPYNVNYPSTGMPQEHYTGQIWGGYLYDLSRVLKNNALKYVYPSSFYFSPAGGHRPGLPDFADAIFAQSVAEFEKYRSQKLTEKAYGSMVSRGLIRPLSPMYSHATNYFWTGAAGSDSRAYISWNFPPRRTLKTEGNLLISGDPHEYAINANAGMVLTATVTGRTGGLTNPVIQLFTIGGALLASSPPAAT